MPPRRDYLVSISCQAVGDDRKCEVEVEASAVVPAFSLSETVLDFGDVPCGQQRVRGGRREREKKRILTRDPFVFFYCVPCTSYIFTCALCYLHLSQHTCILSIFPPLSSALLFALTFFVLDPFPNRLFRFLTLFLWSCPLVSMIPHQAGHQFSYLQRWTAITSLLSSQPGCSFYIFSLFGADPSWAL